MRTDGDVVFRHQTPSMKEKLQPTKGRTKDPKATKNRNEVLDSKGRRLVGFETVLSLLPPPPPSRAWVFQDHYVSHLIATVWGWTLDPSFSDRQYWIVDFSSLRSLHPRNPSEYAIRATAMQFYGSLTGNETVRKDATCLYSSAIQAQRSYIAKLNGKERDSMILDAIFAAMMMGTYEACAGSVLDAWVYHYIAAINLLQKLGPKKCRSGQANLALRELRVLSVSMVLIL